MFRVNALITSFAVATLLPTAALAQTSSGLEAAMAQSAQQSPQPAKEAVPAGDAMGAAQPPKDMELLEVERLIGLQTHDDKFVVVSKNGRYFLKGVLVDTWSQTEIESIDQLRTSKNTIDLDALGVNPPELGAVTVGDGEKRVTVFANPGCDDCDDLFNAMLNPPEDIQYNIFFAPAGPDDRQAAEHISCVPDEQRNEGVLQAVVEGNVTSLPQAESCDRRRYMQMLMLGDTAGIKTNELPFLIRWDGLSGQSSPSLLANWGLKR